MNSLTEPKAIRDAPLSESEQEQVLCEIVDLIRALPGTIDKQGQGNGPGVWTRQIINDFKRLGFQWGYWVCPDPHNSTSAWLCDFCWYRNNEHHELAEVPLVLESEWSHKWKEIRHDFEKLHQAKARFKVMIFEEGDESMDDVWRFLESSIRAFKNGKADEWYVLAAFLHKTRQFEVRVVRDVINPLAVIIS
jgi:hypothetical protein